MSDTPTTRVKNFDFDNDTSNNVFSHLYISYMANEKLQGEEQFHSKNYLLELPRFHAKMLWKVHHKNFIMVKAISKSYALHCTAHYIVASNTIARSRIVTHSSIDSFSIKTILCETNNILFSKNYWKLVKMNAGFWKNI